MRNKIMISLSKQNSVGVAIRATFAVVLSLTPMLQSHASANAGFNCHHWGENAKNVLADYRIRLESGLEDPEAGTKDMFSYDDLNEGKTGKLYYDTILPKVFALVSPEEIYAVAKDYCESMPDDAFVPENFY